MFVFCRFVDCSFVVESVDAAVQSELLVLIDSYG